MAVPDRSPIELATIIHNNAVGFQLGPFTLAAKSARGANNIFDATVTRGPRSWVVTYQAHASGVGRILSIVDEDGRMWAPIGTSWADAGLI